jgi:hypothetical protein
MRSHGKCGCAENCPASATGFEKGCVGLVSAALHAQTVGVGWLMGFRPGANCCSDLTHKPASGHTVYTECMRAPSTCPGTHVGTCRVHVQHRIRHMSASSLFLRCNPARRACQRIAVTHVPILAHDGCASDWHTIHLGRLACRARRSSCPEATAVERRGHFAWLLGLHDDQCETVFAHTRAGVAWRTCPVRHQLAHAGRKASTHLPWPGDHWRHRGPVADSLGVDGPFDADRHARDPRFCRPAGVRGVRAPPNVPYGWDSRSSNARGARIPVAPVPVADCHGELTSSAAR